VGVPPIKCQGIKTKLVPFILSQIYWVGKSQAKWIEPFLGSGVVAFNLAPRRALLADTNQYVIRLYQAIQQQAINREVVREFLTVEGERLKQDGADYYYQVRDRFNQSGSPLDFLFLNRSCFNGLIRFNRHGQFNVPFCRKPQRFSQAYITKIANQVNWIATQMADKDWEFRVATWDAVLQEANPDDFVYLDPPYIGRHTDYYNNWQPSDAEKLATVSQALPCGFALSMWLENRYRQNLHIQTYWAEMETRSYEHFYHVGSKETWRGSVSEGLLIKPGFAVGNG
jgi:DNA adenine methylase